MEAKATPKNVWPWGRIKRCSPCLRKNCWERLFSLPSVSTASNTLHPDRLSQPVMKESRKYMESVCPLRTVQCFIFLKWLGVFDIM